MAVTRYYSSSAVDTTLTAPISGGATSIVVGAVAGFPVQFPYTLSIDADNGNKELVEVSGAAGATLTVARGVDGTSGVSHSLGAKVSHDHSARDFRESRVHEAATSDVHGVTGLLVGATSTQTLINKDLSSGNIFPAAFVTLVGSQTLTNKDLSSATNVFPTTLATLADTQTLTHKDLSSATNTFPSALATLTGSQALTNKDLSSGNTFPTSLVTLTGSQTLTNKTLTSPTINGGTQNSPALATPAITGGTQASPTITTPILTLPTSKVIGDAQGTVSADPTWNSIYVKTGIAGVATWATYPFNDDTGVLTNVLTAQAGWTIITQKVRRIGKLVMLSMSFTRSGANINVNSIGDISNSNVATIGAGYTPLMDGALSSIALGRGAHGSADNATGLVILSAVTGSGVDITTGESFSLGGHWFTA